MQLLAILGMLEMLGCSNEASLNGEMLVCIYMSFCLAHSGQMMSCASVMKPFPTRLVWHCAQMKQSLCQCRSSNEMKRVPPMPGMNKFNSEYNLTETQVAMAEIG